MARQIGNAVPVELAKRLGRAVIRSVISTKKGGKCRQFLRHPFTMKFDIGTIKHLGLQMYSTLPPVIGELVSNSWDADAETVAITVPKTAFKADSEIVVVDDGEGMTDADVREAYLVIGRDRRAANGDRKTKKGRGLMGRKGIGKFSAFGIASEIEVETVPTANTPGSS